MQVRAKCNIPLHLVTVPGNHTHEGLPWHIPMSRSPLIQFVTTSHYVIVPTVPIVIDMTHYVIVPTVPIVIDTTHYVIVTTVFPSNTLFHTIRKNTLSLEHPRKY